MEFQSIDYIVYGLQLLMDLKSLPVDGVQMMGYMLMDLTECQNITKMALQDPKCPYMTPNGPKTLPSPHGYIT